VLLSPDSGTTAPTRASNSVTDVTRSARGPWGTREAAISDARNDLVRPRVCGTRPFRPRGALRAAVPSRGARAQQGLAGGRGARGPSSVRRGGPQGRGPRAVRRLHQDQRKGSIGMIPPLKTSPRYLALDYWRRILCLLVVLEHAGVALWMGAGDGTGLEGWL